MRRLVWFGALALASLSATAQDTRWVNVFEDNEMILDVLPSKKRTEGRFVTVPLRSVYKVDRTVKLSVFRIQSADCGKGQGIWEQTDMEGKVKVKDNWVIGSGNVSSTIAEALCGI